MSQSTASKGGLPDAGCGECVMGNTLTPARAASPAGAHRSEYRHRIPWRRFGSFCHRDGETYMADCSRLLDGAGRPGGVPRKGRHRGPTRARPPRGEAMTQPGTMTAMTKQMQDCVEACMSCHSVCEETMSS